MAADNHPGDQGKATSTAAAATINNVGGVITTEALVTATGVQYAFVLTNTLITASSLVFVSVKNGTNTTLGLVVNEVTPAAGSATIRIKNTNAGALNGTIVISFIVF